MKSHRGQVSMEFMMTMGLLMLMFVGIITINGMHTRNNLQYERERALINSCNYVTSLIANVHLMGDGASMRSRLPHNLAMLGNDRLILVWAEFDGMNMTHYCKHGIRNVTNGYNSSTIIPRNAPFVVRNVENQVLLRDAVLEDNLVFWMPFDGDMQDYSGYDYHGTCTTCPQPVAGKVGGAYEFDGSSTFIYGESDDTHLNVTHISVAVWVYPDLPMPGWATLVNQVTGNSVNGWSLERRGSSSSFNWFVGDLTDGNQPWDTNYVNAPILDNEWQHLVGVYDGEQILLYQNGVLVDSRVSSMGILQGSYSLRIGKHPQGNYYWDGSIDDIRIYNTSLSAAEVQQLYDSYFNPVVELGEGFVR